MTAARMRGFDDSTGRYFTKINGKRAYDALATPAATSRPITPTPLPKPELPGAMRVRLSPAAAAPAIEITEAPSQTDAARAFWSRVAELQASGLSRSAAILVVRRSAPQLHAAAFSEPEQTRTAHSAEAREALTVCWAAALQDELRACNGDLSQALRRRAIRHRALAVQLNRSR